MKGKFHQLFTFACIFFLTGALTGRAEDQAKFSGLLRVPPMAAPVIDGRRTSDVEWQAACQVAGWTDSVLGTANGDGTQVAVGHADGVLYVRFSCPIPEEFRRNRVVYAGFALKMTAKEKDGNILKDDYVGIYLTPPGKQEVYFLGVNGTGIMRDSRNGDVSWNGRWQAQQSLDDFFWMVEFAVPLSQFGGGITEDSAWGVNFTHGARNVELLESRWCFQPAQLYPMAEMRFASRPVAVALAGFGNLSEGSMAFKGEISNGTKEPFEGTLEIEVRDLSTDPGKPALGPEKTALVLKPGEKRGISATFDAGGPLCGKVLVTVKDAKGVVLLDYSLPFVFAREISLETRWIPTPSLLQVVLDLGSPASFKKVTGGTVKIISLETKKEALTETLPAFESSLSITNIDCRKLPVGRYEAAVELKLGAATSVLKSAFIKEPDPEWLGSTAGISEKVPVPWTPLKVEGGEKALKVSCWGRQYTFGQAGFPHQINILGKDILAGPVRILVKRDGKTEVLPAGSCRVTEKKDARVTFKTVVKAGGLEIAAETWMEFDGFVWNTINVKSDSPVEIEGLSIEIPLKKEYATLWWDYFHLAAGMLTDKMGMSPKQPYVSAPMNFLRLGDEEHGMQFFYESLKNWNSQPGRGQELIPGEKEYVLRYNLIGQTTKLEKPLEFALGYIALPCKPRNNLFRRIDANTMWSGVRGGLSKEEMEKRNWLCQTYTYGLWTGRGECNYFNFWNPEVFEPDYLQKFKEQYIAGWEKTRSGLCIYYQGGLSDANTPEYRTYRFEWQPVPGNAPYVPADPKTRDKLVFGPVCNDCRSYGDFYMWCLDKALRQVSDNGRIPVHGYQDAAGTPTCMNTLHGCPADLSLGIRKYREYTKRIYTIFKSINPLNQLYAHTGGATEMSWCSFYDWMTEGEQYTATYLAAIVNDPSLPKDYTKLFNLARFRAQFQPYAWGPECYYLTQFWAWQKEPDEARGAMGHLWGLTLCHDVPVWGWSAPACVARAISEVQWDDTVEFIPYWRKQTGIEVKTDRSPVVASGWQCGKGSLLALVLNDGGQVARGEVKIDFARFGFKPGEVKCRDYGGTGLAYPDAPFCWQAKANTAFDPKQLPVRDTVVQAGAAVLFELGRHSFRLLRFWQ